MEEIGECGECAGANITRWDQNFSGYFTGRELGTDPNRVALRRCP